MKTIIIVSAVLACALAVFANGYGGGYDAGHQTYAAPIVAKQVNVHTGQSYQYRKQDGWGNYKFGYDNSWNDGWGHGAHSRHETGDSWGNKEGSYSLNIGDGRSRVVKYTADGAGFRASIKTNEPGIVASNPAAVNINTPHGYGGSDGGYGGHAQTITHVGGYTTGGHGGYGGEIASYGGGEGGY